MKPPALEIPSTPTRNDFINPVSTPQGSPSKKTIPPGAHDLTSTFDNALKLNTGALDSPIRLGRPLTQNNSSPLSPTKGNLQPTDDLSSANASPSVDESIIHKTSASPGSPLKKQQGQENTPPSRIPVADSLYQHNHAAVSRQEIYHLREGKPHTPTKKFNTHRGLTPEELEILKKPSVRRLVNVTQLCMCSLVLPSWVTLTPSRLLRLLLRPPHLCRCKANTTQRLQSRGAPATTDR